MSLYSKEDIRQIQHRIYLTFLYNPRIYYDKGAKQCRIAKNTFMKYWKEGLKDQVFFPPQIRLKMYRERKEYIYLVQNDKAHSMYEYYKKHPDITYLSYALGKFDLLIQTDKPLEVVPDGTLLHGSRSNYIYPETPYCTFEAALSRMEALLSQSHEPSKITVEYPEEPELKGTEYGLQLLPYLKYNLRPNYTLVVKRVGISFSSFYKGYEYLLKVSTVLLPYYPFGLLNYSQYFFVFRTDYEHLLCELFGYLPCHVSITKVSDALIVYVTVQEGKGLRERFFDLCYRLLDMGLVNQLWAADPVYHWRP